MFGEIHSSLCVRFYVCDAVVYDLQELECPLNPKNTYYIRKKLCKHTLSPQPTINIVKCLQLMLCCCIFLPSLSISVCCHKKNKIWGKAASSVLELYIYIYIPQKLGTDLKEKNRTVCQALSHNYETLFKLLWSQNPFKTWQVRTHLVQKLQAPLKTQQNAHSKVREQVALTSNFQTFHHHVSIIMQGY